MSDETRKAIEELEAIRLSLFRTAAHLDRAIMDLEFTLGGPEGPEFDKMFVVNQRNLREDHNVIFGDDKLVVKEKEAWQKLIASL